MKAKASFIQFRDRDGKLRLQGPLTLAEAERRIRSTQWTPGANPKLAKGKP